MLYYLVTALYVFVCVILLMVILLQQGKGGDMASAFGGGSSQTAFGARGATTLLHKLTVASFVVFILTTVSIAIMKGGPSGTVMAGQGKSPAPAKPAPAAPAPPSTPAPAPANGTPQ